MRAHERQQGGRVGHRRFCLCTLVKQSLYQPSMKDASWTPA